MPKDTIGLLSLYFVGYYRLAFGSTLETRTVFALIDGYPRLHTDAAMQVELRILHLALLLDEGDLTGLESFGRNYKRHLKKLLPAGVAIAGLEVVRLLSRIGNLEDKATLRRSLSELLIILQRYQNSTEVTFKPFVYPLSCWVKRRLGI